MRGYKWYTVLFLIMLVIVQPDLSRWFSIMGVSISFILFFVMLSSFGIKHSQVLYTVISIGLMYDMLYSPWLGRMTLVYLLAALTVFAVNRIVYRENMPILTLFFFFTTYLLQNIMIILEVGPGVFFNSILFIQKSVLGKSLYAAALAGILGSVFFFISMVKDRKLRSRKRQTA